MATFENVNFGLRKGNRADLDLTAVADIGTFNVCKDTKELFMDLDGTRYPINSVSFDYTEEGITALRNPDKKLYIANDTFRLYVFDTVNLRWLIIGEEGVVLHADSADSDGDGRNIRETYYTIDEAETYIANTDASIQELENALDVLSNYIVEIYDNEEDLPTEGITGTIYFVLNSESASDDPVYDEFIWVTDGYYVKIGSTSIDLSNYVTKESLATQLDTVNSSITDLQNADTSILESISDHETRISDLETDNSTNKTNISGLQSSVSSITTTLTNLSSSVSSHDTSIESILETIQGLISSVSNLETSVAAIEEELSGGSTGSSTATQSLSSRISSLESTVSTIADVTASNLTKIDANASSITDLNSTVSTISETVSDIESDVSSLSSSVSTLEDTSLQREDDSRDVSLDFTDEE